MSRRVWLNAVVAGAIAAGLATGVLLVFQPAATPSAAKDMRGNAVVIDGAIPAPKTVTAMHVTPDTGEQFQVPSVGLNVPLGALNEVGGVITPPGFASAYVVRNLGVPLSNATGGTVFVVMHSIRGGGVAPGNYLVDSRAGKSAVQVGATISVGNRRYILRDSMAVPKSELSSASRVWAHVPGRLVVITCLERADGGPSVDNLVLVADLG